MAPLLNFSPKKKVCFRSCSLPDLNLRLADMGMVPGSVWEMIRKIPFSGPMIVGNGQTQISLREEDAARIFVDPA
jgi:Fe2+ transport system protein FeoA